MMGKFNTLNLPKELTSFASEKINQSKKDIYNSDSEDGPLKQSKLHKSCYICGTLFSKKDNEYYCGNHKSIRRNIDETITEAKLFKFIHLAIEKLGCVGVRIYSTAPNSGEKINIQKSYYYEDMSHPAKGASIIIRLSRYLLDNAGYDFNSVFLYQEHINSKDKIVQLAPNADFMQATSAISVALEAAKTGQYMHSRSIKIQLISETEICEDLIALSQEDVEGTLSEK